MSREKEPKLIYFAVIIFVVAYAITKVNERLLREAELQAEIQLDCQNNWGCSILSNLGNIGGFVGAIVGVFGKSPNLVPDDVNLVQYAHAKDIEKYKPLNPSLTPRNITDRFYMLREEK